MSRESMSLKANIRNLARKKDMSPQVVLQNYMFERFLERLSKSKYHDKFILKGGLLIAALVGIDNRSTMDMDATIKNYSINDESVTQAIKDICNVFIDDDVSFSFSGINSIRDEDVYGGYRVSIIAEFDTIITPLQIDISTGDVITPKEALYLYKMIFKEGSVSIWAYNIETILAEKVETILRRGELNTRARDFYDVYTLVKTQPFEYSIFLQALISTATHRETTHIFTNLKSRLDELSESKILSSRWNKYKKDYRYAHEISYEDVMDTLRRLVLGL